MRALGRLKAEEANEMDPLAAIDALIPNMQRLANKSGKIDRFYRLILALVNRRQYVMKGDTKISSNQVCKQMTYLDGSPEAERYWAGVKAVSVSGSL